MSDGSFDLSQGLRARLYHARGARGREVGGRLSERREAALRVARELIS
jgi:hypothetical protein